MDISGEILGTLTLASGDEILKQGTTLVSPHLPPTFQALTVPDALKAQIFKGMGAPELQGLLDLSRPMAVALADPNSYSGRKLGPVIVALPVKDGPGFVDFLGKKASAHEGTPWKDHVLTYGEESIRVRLWEGYALMAGHEKLINGAAGVLGPLVKKTPAELGVLHVDVVQVYKRFGPQIEKAASQMRGELGRSGLDRITVGKMIHRWLGFLKSMHSARLALSIDGALIDIEASARAKGSGEFKDYLGKLDAGEAWGARYLHDGAALSLLTRQSPELMQEEIKDGVDMLEELLAKAAEHPEQQRVVAQLQLGQWRDLLRRVAKHFSGESAWALWATPAGGITMGGAARMRGEGVGQAAMRELMQFVAKELVRLQTKVLRKPLRKELPGFKITLKVRKGRLRVAGLKGDLVELSIRWPRVKGKEQRKAMAKFKRGWNKVMGRKFLLGYVQTGSVVVWAAGKGSRKAMARLVAAARGKKELGMEQTVTQYTTGKKVVTFFYSPLRNLLDQALKVADQVTTLSPRFKEVAARVLPGPDHPVPVVSLIHVKEPSIIWRTQISGDLVGMIVRGVVAGMQSQGMSGPPPVR
jgi:hypothetical protein